MRHISALLLLTFLACTPRSLRAQVIDIEAIRVSNPPNGSQILEKTYFRPQGYFRNVGGIEAYDIPARIRIARCSDNALAFQSDSTIPDVIDASEVLFYLPSKQSNYDVTKLHPGCYRITLIARSPFDENRSNDTTYSEFEIVSTSSVAERDELLYGNAGNSSYQNFQSALHIPAAESMRIYTIDGRLIETYPLSHSSTVPNLYNLQTGYYFIDVMGSSGQPLARYRIAK